MRRFDSMLALCASFVMVGCTLIVDAQLQKPAADAGDEFSTMDDAAAIQDNDAGEGTDAAQSTRDADADTQPGHDAGGSTDAGQSARDADAGTQPGHDAGTDPGGDASVALDAAQTSAPDIQICLGEDHACALNKAGKMTCWGANAEEQGKFPSDRAYRRVACGDYHSCALDLSGTLVCVGRNRDGQRVTEPGPFEEVVAGDEHTCVLDAAGAAHCFGLNTGGQSTPPAVALRSLAAGTGFTCGIRRSDSKVQCWGFGAADLTNAVADVAFSSIDAARNYLCGITDAGAARCWTRNAPPAPDRALKVSAGGFGACALLVDHSVRCWDGNNVGTPFADKGPFRDVIVGGAGRCLLPEHGAILCEPEAPLSSIAPGPATLD